MTSKKSRVGRAVSASALAIATLASGLSFGAASASATTAPQTGATFQLIHKMSASQWVAVKQNGQYGSFSSEAAAKSGAGTWTAYKYASGTFAIRGAGNTCLLANNLAPTPSLYSSQGDSCLDSPSGVFAWTFKDNNFYSPKFNKYMSWDREDQGHRTQFWLRDTSAYRFDTMPIDPASPVPPAANGGIQADSSPTTSLVRNQPTPVPFAVRSVAWYNTANLNIRLTAPAGTRFDANQTVPGQYHRSGSTTWLDSVGLTLSDVTVSTDGKTLTGTFKNVPDFAQFDGYGMRWLPKVIASNDTLAGEGSMGYKITGSTAAGTVSVDSTSPTTVPGLAGGGVVSDVSSGVRLERGTATDVPFAVKSTNQYSAAKFEVTLAAPSHSTFAADQTVAGQFHYVDEDWQGASSLNLTDVSVSSDGKSLTGTFDSANSSGFGQNAGMGLRWIAKVIADSDAAAGNGSMNYSINGSTSLGPVSLNSFTATTIEAPAVTTPTATVTFDQDVTKKATVSGTGAKGAVITIKNGTDPIASATVGDDGTWSTQIDPIGPGSHELTIEQTGIEGTQTTSATADFGAAVTANAPTATVDSTLATVTGRGEPGATITLRDDTGTTHTTTTDADGSWSIQGNFRPDTNRVTVTAQSKGALETTIAAELDINVSNRPLVITSPTQDDAKADRITAGKVTFTGTATPFSTVQLRTWPEIGRILFTTYADENGNWSATGELASSYYELAGKETAIGGYVDDIRMFAFSTVAFQDTVITSPTAQDVILGGTDPGVVFAGTATPGATVEIWTWINPRGRLVATAKADGLGNWKTKPGSLAADTTYKLKAEQIALNGKTTVTELGDLQTESFHAVDQIERDQNGSVTDWTLRATPGATVEIWTGPKTATWARKIGSGTADNLGKVAIGGTYLAPGNAYMTKIYQTTPTKEEVTDYNFTTDPA